MDATATRIDRTITLTFSTDALDAIIRALARGATNRDWFTNLEREQLARVVNALERPRTGPLVSDERGRRQATAQVMADLRRGAAERGAL